MQRNWKYVLPIAVTSLGLFTSVVHADSMSESAQMRNLENRVNALEQRKGAGGMINPQGRPQVRDGADLFIYGDLLYWNAHQNGMNFAIAQDASTEAPNSLDDAKVLDLKGKWNWGFRTGVGYNTMHDGWDLRLTWLRFTDTSKSSSDNSSLVYYPTQATEFVTAEDAKEFATSTRGYWSFNLNQIDLEMGREFFVSKWLTIRPHLGLRTDWIHQKTQNSYFGVDTSSPTDLLANSKDHWWGLGLAGGLSTQWGLGNGWSIFGNAAASILYGFHQISTDINRENIHSDSAVTNVVDLGNTYHMSHPILDLKMGLRWDQMFSKDRFHIGFDIGWEHHVYFSQNQFPVLTGSTVPTNLISNQGDLTMQGWTFSARFDF